MLRLKIIMLVPLLAAWPALAQASQDQDTRRVQSVDADRLIQARKVIRSFIANERHPECYWILFSQQGEYLRVEFDPKGERYLIQVEGEAPQKASKLCGHNQGYLINKNGNIVRRVYSRD